MFQGYKDDNILIFTNPDKAIPFILGQLFILSTHISAISAYVRLVLAWCLYLTVRFWSSLIQWVLHSCELRDNRICHQFPDNFKASYTNIYLCINQYNTDVKKMWILVINGQEWIRTMVRSAPLFVSVCGKLSKGTTTPSKSITSLYDLHSYKKNSNIYKNTKVVGLETTGGPRHKIWGSGGFEKLQFRLNEYTNKKNWARKANYNTRIMCW